MHSDDHSDVRNALDHAHPLGVWRAGAAPRVAVGHRIPYKIKSRANDEQCRASMKQHATGSVERQLQNPDSTTPSVRLTSFQGCEDAMQACVDNTHLRTSSLEHGSLSGALL